MDAAFFCDRFLEKVFYFSLRKTGNEHDAEELASEISVEVLAGLKRGAQPRSFQAWVWRIARNRWARWVRERRGTPVSAMEDIDMLPLPGDEDVEKSAITADDLRRMRRALAFIRSDYRTLLVAHYFEEKSLPAIAQSLNLPLGTVKTRLIRSRRELKEGMEMAREFGKRSFAPEDVNFINNCSRFGDSGQPWTILGHLLYKNIFLEVYDNPETAEALSLELGVALPYMEAELEYLTHETFLIKENGRYETAFPIIGKTAQESCAKRYEQIVPELAKLIAEELDIYAAACERLGEPVQGPWQSYEDAKWMLLMRAVDIHSWAVRKGIEYQYTKRPDGGEWDIIGFQTVDMKLPQPVGQHGGYMHEQDGLPFVSFNSFRFNFRDIRYRTKDFYGHQEIAALKLVCEGKAELCDPRHLEMLEEYGMIRRDGENWAPTIAVFRSDGEGKRFERFTKEEQAAVHDKARRIEAMLAEQYTFIRKAMEDELPERFRKNQQIWEMVNDHTVNSRGYVLEQAVRDGWLRDDESTGRTVGMWMNL
ncbi:MAG: RNA polymerase sigma factor [Christensenellaceae bacterium]|nr:RNA polymerase sigma factor [Christensenellaceae bacterium]